MHRSVAGLAPRRYAPQQVRAWLEALPSPERLRTRLADAAVFTACDPAGSVQAFASLTRDGTVDLLYACPEAAGTGAASAVFDLLDRHAPRRLRAQASAVAEGFFRRRGFVLLYRRALHLGGVTLRNAAMERL